jgi:hypothetical protein
MTTILLTLDETDASHFAAVRARSLFGADATSLALEPVASPPATLWGPVSGHPYPVLAPDQLADSQERTTAIEAARRAPPGRGTRNMTGHRTPTGSEGSTP